MTWAAAPSSTTTTLWTFCESAVSAISRQACTRLLESLAGADAQAVAAGGPQRARPPCTCRRPARRSTRAARRPTAPRAPPASAGSPRGRRSRAATRCAITDWSTWRNVPARCPAARSTPTPNAASRTWRSRAACSAGPRTDGSTWNAARSRSGPNAAGLSRAAAARRRTSSGVIAGSPRRLPRLRRGFARRPGEAAQAAPAGQAPLVPVGADVREERARLAAADDPPADQHVAVVGRHLVQDVAGVRDDQRGLRRTRRRPGRAGGASPRPPPRCCRGRRRTPARRRAPAPGRARAAAAVRSA